jgi:CelD/BcsL family acetyltransferase involved in cellulose biosynthesis
VEDAAQAWLASLGGTPVGAHGDLVVFCLYKTYGLPDGAALLMRGADVRPPPGGPHVASWQIALARRHGAWLAGRSGALAAVATRLVRAGEVSPEDDRAVGTPAAPSPASRWLIPRLPADAADRRRAHYRMLLADLAEQVPAPFAELPDGASPFAFPLAARDKAGLLDRLHRAGIAAVDFWSVPHPALAVAGFPAAARRRASTVLVPVHQELRPRDVDRIAATARARRPRAPRLEWIDDLEAARDDWTRLACASRNVFATWEWAATWWRHYGREGALRLAAVAGPGGDLRALLPLVVWRDRPVRIARFLGHGTADELGPVCAPADRPAAARALRQALAAAGCDVLLAEHLPAADAWPALLGGTVLRRESSPVLCAPAGWEPYLATRTPHSRRKTAWLARRLGRDHDVCFRLADDPVRLGADLDTAFALHRARWPDGSEFLDHEAAHRDLATVAFRNGWLRLWFLELDGTPAACWYGFRYAGVESHLQSGRDPGLAAESVGTVLLLHTIRAALEDGIREYRFLRGGEPYKHRFATADPGLETVAVGHGARGRAAVAGGRLADAVPPLGRALRPSSAPVVAP